jgi:hypothetical protein
MFSLVAIFMGIMIRGGTISSCRCFTMAITASYDWSCGLKSALARILPVANQCGGIGDAVDAHDESFLGTSGRRKRLDCADRHSSLAHTSGVDHRARGFPEGVGS